MLDILRDITLQSWLVLGQMGPYLLFGFLAAGVLSVCIPPAWVERHLGGHLRARQGREEGVPCQDAENCQADFG